VARRLLIGACLLGSLAAGIPALAETRPVTGRSHLHAVSPARASRRQRVHRRLIWADNFNGPAGESPDPEKWSFDTGGNGWGSNELEYYTPRPENAELDGVGHLVVTARSERYTGPDGVTREYTSARLQTLHKFQFQYGLIEARIEIPQGQGLLPQFWMLGDEAYSRGGYPGSGEIDVMEVLGSHPTTVAGTLHGPWPRTLHLRGFDTAPASLAEGFHVYGVEWRPTKISFLLDGAVYKTITPTELPPGAPWPFQHPFFVLLDLAAGGNSAGTPSPATQFPARMIVDWVRVWK
jgi:beta-glucanase (GH16 family)